MQKSDLSMSLLTLKFKIFGHIRSVDFCLIGFKQKKFKNINFDILTEFDLVFLPRRSQINMVSESSDDSL